MQLRVGWVERSETHSHQFSDPPGPVGAVWNRTISVNLGVPNPVGAVCNRTGTYQICVR